MRPVDPDAQRAQGLGIAMRLRVEALAQHVEGDLVLRREDLRPGVEATGSGVTVEVGRSGCDNEQRSSVHGRGLEANALRRSPRRSKDG